MPAATTIFVTAATGIKDRAGNPLAAPFTFSFTTTENTPPTVTSTNPANGATGVSPDLERYSITFSERMKPPISAAMFDMTRNSGLIVINAESYDTVTNTQHYLIRDKLQSLHRYEVQLEWTGPLTDVAGNRLTGEKSFTFTTLDAGPPLVVTTIPSKEATNVRSSDFHRCLYARCSFGFGHAIRRHCQQHEGCDGRRDGIKLRFLLRHEVSFASRFH
jgi:hypothetical protein